MWVDFNINERVRVRLKPAAIALLEQQHNEIFAKFGDKYAFRMPAIDKDGWTEFPLWDLMKRFGEQMHLGMNPLFDTTIQIKTTSQGEGP